MTGIVAASLRMSRLVIAVALGVVLIGATQLGSAKVDYLPDFMPPSVQIQTEALGLSAAEVEQLVTVPLEQDLLNGVPWLDHIHSRSQTGLSAIDVVFENGTDLYSARQMVQERLTQAHALPNVGSPPVMVEPLASVSRVEMIGMSSTSVSLIDMSVLARWKVRPKLMGIPGVANVSIYGMRDRQLQVEVDPAQLQAKGVNLTQVIETAGNALWVSPLTFVEASTPGTGGFIEGAGTPMRLGDVAQVIEDHQPLIGDSVSTTPTLFMVVQKFPGADTAAVTRAVDDAMASLAPGLGGIAVDSSVYRPATFLESAARTVSWTGAALLVAVLVGAALLFWTWRLALVIAVTTVTTVVTTLYVLYLTGATLTSMTLGGVLLAVVIVISQAAAAAEDLARPRAPEPAAVPETAAVPQPAVAHGTAPDGTAPDGTAPDGTAPDGTGTAGPRDLLVASLARSQATAVVGALVCAFLAVPALFLDPLTASFTRAIAIAFGLALLVGTVVGLTVVPATASAVRAGPVTRAPVRARLAAAGERLTAASGRPLVPVAAAAVLLLVGALAIPQLASPSLVPAAQDRNLLVRLEAAPGTSLNEMDRITGLVGDKVRQVPGVATVGGHVGRAVGSDQLGDVNAAEIWVALAADADYAATRAAVGSVVGRWPGVSGKLDTYPAEQVAAVAAAGGHDLVVRLFGQDLAALQKAAGTVATAVGGVDHVRDAHVQAVAQQPAVQVEVDLAAAQKFGLRPGDVRREATTLASGLTVGNLYEQAQVFDVVVRGTPNVRSDLTGLANLAISTPDGGSVRLGDVAKLTVTPQPASIVHDQVQRSVDVVARIDGGDLGSVLDAVRSQAGSVPMPPESHLQVLSSAQDERTDLLRTLAVGAAVLVAVLLVLQALLGSWRRAALLMLLSPLGLAGAAALAPLVGGLGTVGPLLGAVAGVMLVLVWGLTVLRGSRGGAGPLLAAVLVAVALLPAAFVTGPGTELLRPFAITTLGALVSALVVVLVVLPAVAGRPEGEPA